MNCPNDFTYAQFIDGELPDQEANELVAHLEFCAVCRERVDALQTEKQLIIQSLQGMEAHELERVTLQEFPGFRNVAVFMAVFSGGAALLRMGWNFIFGITAPAGLDWASPFSLSGLLGWFGNAMFYFIERGDSMITSFVERASIVIVGLLIIKALIPVVRRTKAIASIVCLMAVMFAFVMPGYAIDYRQAAKMGGNVLIPSEEKIDDTLVVIGDSVKIRGTVTGDLIAIARKVDIQGTIQGNVICLAQTLDNTGNIEGDVFTLGQYVQMNGLIGGNFWAGATILTLGTKGRVQNNSAIFATNLNIDGEVGRDLFAAGGYLDIGGAIGRNVKFSGERILVQTPAKIGRNLHAYLKTEKNAQIDSNVVIGGERKIELIKSENKYLTFRFYLGWFFYLAAAFLLGLLLFGMMPKAGQFSFSTARVLFTSGSVGLLIFVAMPIAALFLAIPLFSLPIGFLFFVLWFIGLFLGPIVVANYIGRIILKREDATLSTTARTLIIGLVIVVVVVNIPYIGPVLNFLLILIGLGALAIAGCKSWALHRRIEASIA
jgi:cytoskeletal protein CcmA (bactofilin family)